MFKQRAGIGFHNRQLKAQSQWFILYDLNEPNDLDVPNNQNHPNELHRIGARRKTWRTLAS
jgi:hypothetical protein